jgi:hypothetical protein
MEHAGRGPVLQTGWHRDSESENLGPRGGYNVWIRAARDLIDYLFGRLASTKSVRTESHYAVKFFGTRGGQRIKMSGQREAEVRREGEALATAA